jgi:hypothetical protein
MNHHYHVLVNHLEDLLITYQHQRSMKQYMIFIIINILVTDKIITSLGSRFRQSVFPSLYKVEKFILSKANDIKEDDNISLNDIKEFLADDVDVEQLERELRMLSDYFSTVNKKEKKTFNLKRITKISTICEFLNEEQVGKSLFCEYRKLLLLHLTIPTTTTTKRSFSALNRIETCLHDTMIQ